jgi:hypothetical protein
MPPLGGVHILRWAYRGTGIFAAGVVDFQVLGHGAHPWDLVLEPKSVDPLSLGNGDIEGTEAHARLDCHFLDFGYGRRCHWWMLGTTIIDVASIDTDCSSPERAH